MYLLQCFHFSFLLATFVCAPHVLWLDLDFVVTSKVLIECVFILVDLITAELPYVQVLEIQLSQIRLNLICKRILITGVWEEGDCNKLSNLQWSIWLIQFLYSLLLSLNLFARLFLPNSHAVLACLLTSFNIILFAVISILLFCTPSKINM